MDERKRLDSRKRALSLRAGVIQALRAFFIERGYLEVETPQLIPEPPPEPHIEPVPAQGGFLQTSPEICMKRLLASGYSRVFQICRCFRDLERGDLHLPEFTLLEWYRAGIGYTELMRECEDLFPFLSKRLGMDEKVSYRGRDIQLAGPWERISVSDCFSRVASLSMERAMKEGKFEEILARDIEPNLGLHRPVILCDYPAEFSGFAKAKRNDPGLAERFEIYIGGIEVANGFSELTDSHEQRRRFEKDRKSMSFRGRRVSPLPEKFLASMEFMPDSAGIALGVDRLAMIFTGESVIDEVVTFTPEEL